MNYLAVVGITNNIKILDRRGNVKKELPVDGARVVQSMEWDMESDTISLTLKDSNVVLLWPVFTKSEFSEITVGEGEQVTFQKWSNTHPVLAIGTKKGGLIFFNKRTKKKNPTVFKHSKQVYDGDWNAEGNLSRIIRSNTLSHRGKGQIHHYIGS